MQKHKSKMVSMVNIVPAYKQYVSTLPKYSLRDLLRMDPIQVLRLKTALC